MEHIVTQEQAAKFAIFLQERMELQDFFRDFLEYLYSPIEGRYADLSRDTQQELDDTMEMLSCAEKISCTLGNAFTVATSFKMAALAERCRELSPIKEVGAEEVEMYNAVTAADEKVDFGGFRQDILRGLYHYGGQLTQLTLADLIPDLNQALDIIGFAPIPALTGNEDIDRELLKGAAEQDEVAPVVPANAGHVFAEAASSAQSIAVTHHQKPRQRIAREDGPRVLEFARR